MPIDSFKSAATLNAGNKAYRFHALAALLKAKIGHVDKLPFTLKILLENLLRQEDGANITAADIKAVASWNPKDKTEKEIVFMPARVVFQDFTGVPCVVDLASMRDTVP
jgi:aconitate hydratase